MKCIVSSALGLVVAVGASADTTLLDIPSGNGPQIEWASQGGFTNIPFEISHENIVFRGGNHATFGVVRAWDHQNDVNDWGKIDLYANEGKAFTSLGFDLSGFKQYESTARMKVYVGTEKIFDETWDFAGNSTLIHEDLAWDISSFDPSIVKIRLFNLSGNPYNGLDNLNVGLVPSPGVLAMFGLCGGLARRRRRD